MKLSTCCAALLLALASPAVLAAPGSCERIQSDISPVSYTHLDVYKRQGEARQDLTIKELAEKFLALKETEVAKTSLNTYPVSYTHLLNQ